MEHLLFNIFTEFNKKKVFIIIVIIGFWLLALKFLFKRKHIFAKLYLCLNDMFQSFKLI